MARFWLAIGSLTSALILAAACGDSGNGDAGEGDASGSGSNTTTAATETSTESGTGTSRGETGSASAPTVSGSGESGGLMCENRGDCELFSDCCRCDAVHVDENPIECPADCDRAKCQLWGVTEVACRSGMCMLAPVECDPSTVVCDAPAPECREGTVPSIIDGCWTGGCVPMELCSR